MSLPTLEEHRRIWDRKPVLERVYRAWFDALLGLLPQGAQVLEVGAGPGFFSLHARRARPDLRWVASDLTPAPWNDVAADAGRLPLRSASVEAVVGLDVIHHLGDPGRFLGEAARVLKAGGRLAAVEPWVTPFSYPVYRWLHQEGCRPGVDPWRPFGDRREKEAFEGDNGILTRLVRVTPAERWRSLGFRPPQLVLLNGFAYLLSLGFREGSLLPSRLAPLLLALDRRAAPLASLLGMRALAFWDREGS